MLKIAGSANLSFLFPADRITAYKFYSDMERLVSHLKHIEIVDSLPDHQYRLHYHTSELGAYQIHVYCDVRMDTPGGHRSIRIVPLDNLPPIEAKATLNTTTARGYYSSEATFRDEGEQTRIEYKLQLQADLPRPLGMRLMLKSAVNSIARGMTNRRIKEIAEHFIASSVSNFQGKTADIPIVEIGD